MTRTFFRSILYSVALVFLASTPVWAQANQDEERLQATRADIDKDANSTKQNRVQALSTQFNVSTDTVEDLRAKKQGWGEITIRLAMAQHLTKTDAQTYPTMNDALAKIDSLRSENKGWGKISQDLGFKLGPVVRDAQQARQELAREARAERTDRVAKQDRVDRPDRPQRPERPERPNRPERVR
jgi:hypothetical protein